MSGRDEKGEVIRNGVRRIAAMLAVGLLAGTAGAEITFDATSTGNRAINVPAGAVTWSHTVGSGDNRMLVVGVTTERATTALTVSSVTFGGQSLSQVSNSRAVAGTTTLDTTELWYLAAPNVGTATITVTLSATDTTSGGVVCGAVSLFGVKQQAAEAVSNWKDDANGTAYSLAITTLTDNAWVVDVVNHAIGSAANGAFTPGSGMTERWDLANAACTAAGSTRPVTTAGTVVNTWTYTGTSAGRRAHSIAAFAPEPSAVIEPDGPVYMLR